MMRRDTASNASSSTLGMCGKGEGEGGGGLDLVHLFTVIDVLAEDSQRSRTWQNKYTYNSHIQ